MSYTCPYCQMTSHNPNDERYKYCGNCHKFEDECRPPPPPVVWDQQPPAPKTLRAAVVDVLKLLAGR